MTTNVQPFAFAVEPEYFNEVLERVDAIALEQNSNRSAVLRQIVYDYFGIKTESRSRNLTRMIKQQRMMKQ